jgi:hypothetical protein
MAPPSPGLNDLPRYSRWPARLLGLEPWSRPPRTPADNTREYEGEKWGPLLQRARAAGAVSLAEVDAWVNGADAEVLASDGDTLVPLTVRAGVARHRDLVAETLARYWPASALVELGCGYGGVIVDVARRPAFRGAGLLAAEYTPSGAELTGLVAAAEGLGIRAGRCDFLGPGLTDLPVPEGALVFTSFAVHYVPELPATFVDALLRWRPRTVIHFEPCYEHCDAATLLGLLRQRYIQVNDYNRNLVSLLRGRQAAGAVRLLEERPAVFGTNALLPASVLAWAPA